MDEEEHMSANADAPEQERKAQAVDRFADMLERLAFKLHDFGNWLLGFFR